jgi:hypothetical protein
MTARNELEQAKAERGGRLHRLETICGPRGACEREPLTDDPGRWTWCADCATLYDDYGVPINPVSVRQRPGTRGALSTTATTGKAFFHA